MTLKASNPQRRLSFYIGFVDIGVVLLKYGVHFWHGTIVAGSPKSRIDFLRYALGSWAWILVGQCFVSGSGRGEGGGCWWLRGCGRLHLGERGGAAVSLVR